MKESFKQISTEIPTPTLEYFKRNFLTRLSGIGCYLYLNTMSNPKTTMNNLRLSNTQQQEEDKLKL